MLNGLIDPQAIHYLGGSQGGIMGATTLQAQVAQLGKADELLVGLSGPPRADWSRSSPADIQSTHLRMIAAFLTTGRAGPGRGSQVRVEGDASGLSRT